MLDFGLLKVGESKTKSLSIKNIGKIEISIKEVNLQDSSLYHFTNDYSNTLLQPGESRAIKVVYSPTAVSNMDSDSLIIKTSKANYTYPIIGKADIDESVQEFDNSIIKVAPNPIAGQAKIEITTYSYRYLKIYLCNLEGKKVLTVANYDAPGNKQEFTFDATNIVPGTYTLFIELDNKIYTSKIIIAR